MNYVIKISETNQYEKEWRSYGPITALCIPSILAFKIYRYGELNEDVIKWCDENDVRISSLAFRPLSFSDMKFHFKNLSTLAAFRLAWL